MPPKSSLTEISLRYLGVFLNSNSGFNFYVRTLIIIILHSQDLLSRNVLSNVPVPKAVSSHTAIDRWSDCIGPDRDSRHLGTLSTILQHFTHNESSLWNPVTHCCSLMSLCAAGCILHAKLTSLNTYPSPGSPRVTILSARPVRTLVHCVVKHSRPPDLKSSSNISLPFAWITGPHKWTQRLAGMSGGSDQSITLTLKLTREWPICCNHSKVERSTMSDFLRVL